MEVSGEEYDSCGKGKVERKNSNYADADYASVDLSPYLRNSTESSTDTLLLQRKVPMDKLKSLTKKPNHVSKFLLNEKGLENSLSKVKVKGCVRRQIHVF